jgi:hypothetical protein
VYVVKCSLQLWENLKEKSSRTTSEFSVIDEKLSSSIVKLAGRNEIPETFWKSVGPAVWTYTEIPKGQRYKLLMRLKIIKKVKVYQCDNEW